MKIIDKQKYSIIYDNIIYRTQNNKGRKINGQTPTNIQFLK